MTGLEAVKKAQQRATDTGQPWLVVKAVGVGLMVVPDGKRRNAKLIERCWP